LVQNEVERYRTQGSTITLKLPPASITVPGDPVGLRRVVTNLVDNALRYGGRSEVALKAVDGYAELLVDDPGRGIPKAEREAVFEPFYRLDPSRNFETGGSGLGLALSRQIVEAHAGRIMVADRPGGGARLRVMLPLGRS
jgi:signal transduction histidine kinase